MARFLGGLRNRSYFSEFIQGLANTWDGKLIIEIKQLNLSGGQEFMRIWKERGKQLFISM